MLNNEKSSVSSFDILKAISGENTSDGIAMFPTVTGFQKSNAGGIVSVGVAPEALAWLMKDSHFFFLMAVNKADYGRIEAELSKPVEVAESRPTSGVEGVQVGAVASVYSIRNSDGNWANVTIDVPRQGALILSILSSYGSYQYFWQSTGEDARKFLLSLDIDYLANKFGMNQWFDLDSTVSGLLDQAREYAEDSDEGEEGFERMEAEIMTLEDYTDRQSFELKAYDSDLLRKLWDTGPNIYTDIDPAFRKFWDTLWVKFQEQLKYEISSLPKIQAIVNEG